MARISAPERRDLLFAAALRVLSRDGLAALSTRAIVAEAGMSLASFHYVYDSREQLLGDVISSVVDGERTAGFTGLDTGAGDLRSALRGGLDAYLELLAADPGREQGMFELTQYALRTPNLVHLARAQYERYHALAADLLEHLATELGTRWSRPVPELARLLVALTDGLTLAWLADRDDAAAQRLADVAVDALLAHARVSEPAR